MKAANTGILSGAKDLLPFQIETTESLLDDDFDGPAVIPAEDLVVEPGNDGRRVATHYMAQRWAQ